MKSLALVVAGVLVALGLGALVIPEVLIGMGRNMASTRFIERHPHSLAGRSIR